MSANSPIDFPSVILESKELAESYARGTLTPEQIRLDEQVQ